MAHASFDDFYVATQPEYAIDFAEAWWGSVEGVERYWLSLLALPSAHPRFFRYADLLDRMRDPAGLDPLVYPRQSGTARQDIYHANALFGEKPQRGRGRNKDVAASPGAWLDLDVKEGSFASGADIYALINGPLADAGVKPSISIRTNGMDGGRHFYWLTDEPLTAEQEVEASERLWLYVQQIAGVKVDNLSDPARIFRLPGTVRWSKNGEGVRDGLGALVTPDYIGTARVSLNKIREVTGDAWKAWKDSQSRIRRERWKADREALRAWQPGSLGFSDGLALEYALYEAREIYPLKVTWAAILEPKGWTRYGEPDDQGHQMWTRPHEPGEKVNPRSAVTDWDDSPNVMSLLSDSPATGLTRLVDAGIPLTKIAVTAELYFGGSERAALLAFIAREQARERGEGT